MRSRSPEQALIGLMTVLLALAFLLPAAVDAAPGDEVVDLAASGKIQALRARVSGGLWAGAPASTLASSVLESDGLGAVRGFESVVKSNSASPVQKTLAYYHLYGFAVLTEDRGRMNQAIDGMRQQVTLAERLMGRRLPDPMPESWYAVQIGAFGSVVNARRLAEQQSARGYTAAVEPIKSGGRTLHAVWVGRFGSREDAASFGNRVFGREGRDFRVVEKSE
jgi:hypothetical protein